MNSIFPIQIILALLMLSGLIAFIGNWIGRYFGKRRLTLFNLRPRRTATVFTVFSGMLIMVLTFGTLLLVSQNVRTAIFGLEKLKAEVSQTRLELETARKELTLIQAEKIHLEDLRDSLRKAIDEQKSRAIVFSAESPVYITLLAGGQGKEKAESGLNLVLEKINEEVKKYKIEDTEVDQDDFDATVSYIANTDGEIVLQVISEKNVVLGGTLPIRLEVDLNDLVYRKDEEIFRSDLSGKLTQAEVEERVKELLSAAQAAAKIKGIIPDVLGSMGEVAFEDIYNTARRIRSYGILTKVKVIAAKDIYKIGPLAVKFDVSL